jgi:hypothetical protein
MAGRRSLTVYNGMFAIPENAFINVKNSSIRPTPLIKIRSKKRAAIHNSRGPWRTNDQRNVEFATPLDETLQLEGTSGHGP